MSTFATLAVRKLRNHVTHVSLNRPKKGNAMNSDFWGDMRTCFQEIANDADCRAIVLDGGDSKFFTVGLDIKDPVQAESLFGSDDSKDAARKGFQLRKLVLDMQESFSVLEK